MSQRDHRSNEQQEFDLAKHGWVFCNASSLAAKISRLEILVKKLAPQDKRIYQLEAMQLTLTSLRERDK